MSDDTPADVEQAEILLKTLIEKTETVNRQHQWCMAIGSVIFMLSLVLVIDVFTR